MKNLVILLILFSVGCTKDKYAEDVQFNVDLQIDRTVYVSYDGDTYAYRGRKFTVDIPYVNECEVGGSHYREVTLEVVDMDKSWEVDMGYIGDYEALGRIQVNPGVNYFRVLTSGKGKFILNDWCE